MITPTASKPLSVPRLTTDRLSLVPLSFSHSEMMFTLWSHPEVCRFSGAVHDHDGNQLPMPAPTAAISDKIIDFWLHARDDGWGFRWVILKLETDTPIGIVGFNSLGPASEIAYHLDPARWGEGFMSEAANAAIAWRRARGGYVELEAFIDPANMKSIALTERLGLSATETFSDGARRYHRKFRDGDHEKRSGLAD